MITEIPKIEMPKWLADNEFRFNIQDVIKDSLYYPSCGMDGIPIQCFMGNIYSFIYVDYGITERDFIKEVTKDNSIKGYNIIHNEKITKYQLDNGEKVDYAPKISDRRIPYDWIKEPYCFWIIFERDENYDDTHNPKRFSLLSLCSDAVPAYYVLYNKNNIAPKILCIIQDGSGFGGNWTSYKNRDLDLAQAVFLNKNLPEYLINGGYGTGYDDPIWPEYRKKIYSEYFPRVKIDDGWDDKSFILWGKSKKI